MIKNNYNQVYFLVNDKYDKWISQNHVNPQPDTQLRVFMFFKSINSKRTITAQHFRKIQRTGFALVEWGGMEIE